MTTIGYTLFDTPLGRYGVAWGDLGVVALQLPERDDQATRLRLLRRHGDAGLCEPPATIGALIESVVALTAGERRDLSQFSVDMREVPAFDSEVYAIARTVQPGSTMTYGEIARRLGAVSLSREVGQALGRNPFTVIVPCHRIIAAGGKLGGFSAHGGPGAKRRLLAIEGATISDQPSLFDPVRS